MTNRFLPLSILAMMALAPLGAHATQYVIDGIRYDCTGSGNNAKAIIQPAGTSDEPYTGDIVIPESVTIEATGKTFYVKEAKMSAFAECDGLTSVTFPSGMTTLGNYLFEDSKDLVSVVLPTDAYALPMGCFKGCTALESIEINSGFGSVNGNAFEGCTSLKEVALNMSGYLLGANAFKGCTALESIVIPDNVTLLGVNLFEGCTSLVDVTLPASLSSMPDYIFKDCAALTTYVLGDKVKSIGKGSFTGCAALQWIECTNTTTAVTLNATVAPFDETFMTDGIFYVPDDMVDAYKESLIGAANVLPVSLRDVPPTPEWESRGEATFYDPWICSVFNIDHYCWTVEVEESTERPGYFRMKNPYLGGNCPYLAAGEANDIYINATDPTMVYIETQGLGFCPNYSIGPEFFVSSVAGRHQENNIQSLEQDKAEGLTGFYKDGIIKIPANATLWSLPPYEDGDFYQCKYDFELRFSDALIYEVACEVMCIDEYYSNLYKECVNFTEEVPIMVAATDCVDKIKYAVFPGVVTPTAKQLAAIATEGEDIQVGRHDFTVPSDYVGRLTAVFVALDADGDVRDFSTCLFDVINEELYGPWKELGSTMYEDVIIYSIYEAGVPAYNVKVEESESRPGLYRLKDVYSTSGYWTSHEGNLHHHDDYSHYLYINAEDPDAVYVMPSPIGFKANDGAMLLTSAPVIFMEQGYAFEDVLAIAPHLFGTLVDGKITIPAGAVYASESAYKGGQYYGANNSFQMVVELPKGSGVDAIAADAVEAETTPRYYNLQGVEIAEPAHGTPAIMIKGGRATKIIR